MADGKIKISELNEALQIDDNAQVPYSQENGGVQTTFKGPISQIARKIAEGITLTNLTTTAKTLVGAVNELKALGSPIILGTTSPTAQQGADGNIYVQYTEGTGGAADTVDSIYAKIDGAWCEIETGGSGGSGGHTILDDEGTSLTQRDDLQFKGAYSEDDSTNDKTVVNVARTMTLAEFEQLTADEKAGFINVKDETSGSDDKFQPVIFSEDEREIGVWIDGKPLYQKTVYIATITGPSTDVAHGISNLDWIVDYSLIGLYAEQTKEIAPSSGSYGTIGVVIGSWDSTNISFNVGNLSYGFSDCYLTIRYTKTTDQAGSGQWTPQGVPAVHYSTDEHIVGTWIDGSTLYEKTVIVPITANTSFDVILTWLQENDTVFIKEGFLLSGGARRVLNFYVTSNFYGYTNVDWYNNAMHLGGTINGYSGNAYVTLRYTKSST